MSHLERSKIEAQRDNAESHRVQAALQNRKAPTFFICDRAGEIAFCSPDLVDGYLIQRSLGIVATLISDGGAPANATYKTLDSRFLLRIVPLSGARSGYLAVFFETLSSRNSLEGAGRRFDLTKRELQVLELIAAGCFNAQIAEKLFISEATVGDHVKNIYRKTNTNRRSALLAQLYRNDFSVHSQARNPADIKPTGT